MTPDRFENREDAGRRLAAAVLEAGPYADPLVLALPRGGVPIAVHVARQLDAPLDLLLVRKIGLPRHEELAAGAVVGGAEPQVVQNPEIIRSAGLSEAEFDALRDFMSGREQARLLHSLHKAKRHMKHMMRGKRGGKRHGHHGRGGRRGDRGDGGAPVDDPETF